MRARPRFNEWACMVAFEIDQDFVSTEVVLELFNRAGKVAGVGDFRPGKQGIYGRYKVELVD